MCQYPLASSVKTIIIQAVSDIDTFLVVRVLNKINRMVKNKIVLSEKWSTNSKYVHF